MARREEAEKAVEAPAERREYRVGDRIRFRGTEGVVFRVYPAGTVDVECADGSCYRLTGLA